MDAHSIFPARAHLLHDFEIYGKSRLEINGYPLYPQEPWRVVGIPSTVRAIDLFNKNEYLPMKCNWQRYVYMLIRRQVVNQKPNLSESEKSKLSAKVFMAAYTGDRFQCNKRGTDNNRKVCIPYKNINYGKQEIGVEPIYTGGAHVSVVGSRVSKGLDSHGNPVYYYPVQCFKITDTPPNPDIVNQSTNPEMVFIATIETRKPIEGNGREIDNFDLAGIKAIPYIVLSVTGTVWIEEKRIHFD
jgi:hypothetical protein